MHEDKKVAFSQLKCDCESHIFDFETTDEIKPLSEELIGQDRAVKAMKLGLRVKHEGYNIFISGHSGTGRTTYAKTLAEEKSKDHEVPDDLCYVYNFTNSEEPQALKVPAGTGIHLQADMDNLIEELKAEIPEVFAGEEYEQQKNKIMNDYQQKSNKLMEEFENEAQEKGFILQNTPNGLVPVPVNDEGEPIKQEEFQQLDDEKRNELRDRSQKIQNDLKKIMRQIRQLKSEAQEELKNQEKKIAFSVIQPIIANLEDKYDDCSQIINYLEQVQEDITQNLDKFRKNKEETSSNKAMIPYMKKDDDSFFTRYKVNLLINNEEKENAPVIHEPNPNYYNLFGKIEGKSELGTITTDFTMIKSGAIHEANGGYLILKAKDVLTKPLVWEKLKRILVNEEVVVENISEQYRTIPITTLKPEAISLDVKVIMVGSPMIYQLLYHYDEEFKKLFKIKADFDVEMKRTEENMKKFASFVSFICEREGIGHFTVEAVSQVIEYSSRLAGDKEKMSTRFNEIMELLFEADAWAEIDDSKEYIDREHIIKAVNEKEYRSNLLEEKIQEMIEKEHILVDVKGEVTGQINGLSVYQTGQYTFGRPSRITARTFLGKKGVINIEREADMSGKIHNKGVMILSGFLGGKYAQDRPLSLSASLAFEQSYGGIDGDSASCAELIALLSAISDLPINQELAITGSMNQKGKVQPIGGVNDKIEGFYKVCELKGLTGNQGVVIPEQNLDNLMLKQEVMDAVEEGKFSIYAVKEIDEAIEIMLNTEASEVHSKIEAELEKLANKATEFKGSKGEEEGN